MLPLTPGPGEWHTAVMLTAVPRVIVLTLALAVPVACGGTTTNASAESTDAETPSDALPSDALPSDGPAGDSSACVATAKEADPCSAGQVSCDRVDLCCASALTCEAGTWQLTGQQCLLCETHPCGTETCQGDEMCLERSSGVDGGSAQYSCVPYPSECKRQWTCECVMEHSMGLCWSQMHSCEDKSFPVTLLCPGV